MSWTDPAFADVAEFVRSRAGLVFPLTRHEEVEAGTRKVMAGFGMRDVREFLGRASAEASVLDALIAEVTIGETYFFREQGHFAFVRDEAVPEIRRLRGATHPIRAWSAGCASGEEAYSLAILFEELGLARQSRILATDISRTQLSRAKDGVYGSWSLRGDAARLVGAHVHLRGRRFCVTETIKQRVEFSYLNLAQDTYPTVATGTWGMDLVLCRNVLIYFSAETIRAAARRLYACLAPGGFLITGSSDPLLGDAAPFDTLVTPGGLIYRRRPDPERAPPRSTAPEIVVRRREPVSTRFHVTERSAAVPPIESARPTDASQSIADARHALARGDSRRAVELTRQMTTDPLATSLCLRGLANLGDVAAAAAIAAEAAARHPTSEEIGFLLAVFLMNLERYVDAARALRRVLYLNRSLIVAHFALGSTLHRLGRLDEAERAYRNARDLAARCPADALVPLADGERAERVVQAAAARLTMLQAQRGAR